MKTYNKLVRDKIPHIIKKNGGDCEFRTTATEVEYGNLLLEKLREEIKELTESKTIEELTEEFADIMEVLEAISKYLKIDLEKVKEVKKNKKLERGGFRKKIVLIKS